MTTWEYRTYVARESYAQYFLKRRSDRYCEHCAKAITQMDALEQVVLG